MKCENREEKISLYIDRQLDWKEEKEFLRHIKECPECKKELQQAQQLRQILLDLPMEEVPEGLHANIMKSIQKEMEVKKSPSRHKKANVWNWYRYGAIAASFLILVSVGAYFYHGKSTANTPQLASMSMEDVAIEEMAVEDVEQEVNQISPDITQSRSVKAPETSKALPATPYLGSPKETASGGAESTEEGAPQQDIENENGIAVQSEGIEEQDTEQQNILTQPTENKKETSDDEGDTESAEVLENKEDVSANAKRSIPTNMKSKSLEMTINTKQIQKASESIIKRTKVLKGEIETQNETSITIKVPLAEYNTMTNWLEQQYTVTNKNEITEDLGKQYKEIQQQQEQAKSKEKQATEKGQSRRAQEARKVQKECQTALEELQKTAEYANIRITFVEE